MCVVHDRHTVCVVHDKHTVCVVHDRHTVCVVHDRLCMSVSLSVSLYPSVGAESNPHSSHVSLAAGTWLRPGWCYVRQ